MSHPSAVPIVVASPSEQAVDRLRAQLRHGGLVADLQRAEDLTQLPALLARRAPELLLCVEPSAAQLTQAAALRNAHDPQLPLLAVRESLTEEQIAADLAHGARDAVSLSSPLRLQSVIGRELRAWRLDQALKDTLTLAQDTHRQTQPLAGPTSGDARVVVQDGMVVSTNAGWQQLLGLEPKAQLGLPVLDLFDDDSHPRLKAALVACNKGSTGERVEVQALRGDGSTHSVSLWASTGTHAGAKCIELTVPGVAAPADSAVGASDAVLARGPLLDMLQARLGAPLQGGSRYLACLRIDGFADIERSLGVRDSQLVLDHLQVVTQGLLLPQDLLGRYSSTGLCALIERGTDRDASGWVQRLQQRLATAAAPWADASVKPTVSAGLVSVPVGDHSAQTLLLEALDALRSARAAGNNQCVLVTSSQGNTRLESFDEEWVDAIRDALDDDRFRLVQMPVASLRVMETGMYDVLLRMVDSAGRDISPTQFLPAAQRNGLMRNIDRWVLTAALQLALRRNPTCLFLRLSTESALDPTLMTWLDAQLRISHVPPQRLCIQVPEETAVAYPQQVTTLAHALRSRRLRFTLEHFGIGPAPLQLLDALPLDFIKIDGSLMQGLAEDATQRERVRAIATAASGRGIAAIAERIEDANTMAALWDLGVELLQGHLIGMHEEVVLASA